MPKTDRTRPFSPLFAGRCRGRCLCRNWFGLPPEDDRICRSGRNAVERRNLSALFAVRSGRPETCHVRTQTNNHHCAKRAIISALHRRRNQIGRRFERPERACKTTGSRRVQRPLADFAEPPQSKRRNPLRRKSGVFCARSVSAGVGTRCFSPCLIFWCFWIKTKAQEERKCTTEEIDSPERIPTPRSAASYLRAEGCGPRPRWRASAGGDFNPHGAKARNISSRIVGFRKAETWPAWHVAP